MTGCRLRIGKKAYNAAINVNASDLQQLFCFGKNLSPGTINACTKFISAVNDQ